MSLTAHHKYIHVYSVSQNRYKSFSLFIWPAIQWCVQAPKYITGWCWCFFCVYTRIPVPSAIHPITKVLMTHIYTIHHMYICTNHCESKNGYWRVCEIILRTWPIYLLLLPFCMCTYMYIQNSAVPHLTSLFVYTCTCIHYIQTWSNFLFKIYLHIQKREKLFPGLPFYLYIYSYIIPNESVL